jgi:hypothetical protein
LDGDADFDTSDGNAPEGHGEDPEFGGVFEVVHRDEAQRCGDVDCDFAEE